MFYCLALREYISILSLETYGAILFGCCFRKASSLTNTLVRFYSSYLKAIHVLGILYLEIPPHMVKAGVMFLEVPDDTCSKPLFYLDIVTG